MYKVTFYRVADKIKLREFIFKNVYDAEVCYFQHCNMNTVRAGYNSVIMGKIKTRNKNIGGGENLCQEKSIE
jgi:hypothetical protein